MSTEGRIPAELWLFPLCTPKRGCRICSGNKIGGGNAFSVLSVFNPAWARQWFVFFFAWKTPELLQQMTSVCFLLWSKAK